MKKLITLILLKSLFTLMLFAGEPYKAGDTASDFSLKNVKGQMVSLSGFDNARGFIVVFTCNTCPVAKKYEQRVIDLNKKFSNEGFPVIAINSNDKDVSPGDSFEEMKNIAMRDKYDFEYLYDESQSVAKQYGATNTPHVYVLSKKDGVLKVEYTGAIDNNADDPSSADKKYVEDAVNRLLKGEQIAITGTKAIGCSIKWKRA